MSFNDFEDDYYQGPSEFDEAVEGFKGKLRESVKQETQDELAALRKANAELNARVVNLDKLERDAARAKLEYETKLRMGIAEAQREAKRETANGLLSSIAEPHFTVRSTWVTGEKCDLCDAERRLHYTTPRGAATFESCRCADTTRHHVVDEVLAYEVAKRNGRIMVWYVPNRRYIDDGEGNDYFSGKVLSNPDGVPMETLTESYNDYGFKTEEAAQEFADALNAKEAKL